MNWKRWLCLLVILSMTLQGCGKSVGGTQPGANSGALSSSPAHSKEDESDSSTNNDLPLIGIFFRDKDSADIYTDFNADVSDLANAPLPGDILGQGGVLAKGQSSDIRDFIDPAGTTLETRIRVPDGYIRTKIEDDSIGAFLRNYEMKEDGSPVLLYNGKPKGRRSQVAVFTLPLEAEDLQQCADSVMRVWGEYYYARGEFGQIRFTLGDDFTADFSTWSQGNGILVEDDVISWTDSERNDESYESFQRFMRMVFAYSGTLNMAEDSRPIGLDELQIGDIFIKGGSPGHVVMVVDLCENADGEKAFLLAQGHMPAQEFHVLKNPLHEGDPWYYASEVNYPFKTADYTFGEGSLKRYKE